MLRRLLLTSLIALTLPATAQAAPVLLDGDPLNIWTDESGRLQVRFEGTATGEFYSPGDDAANAGFHLAIYDPDGTALFGAWQGTAFTPVSGPTFVGGSGTPGDPARLETIYSAGGGIFTLDVTQTIFYVNGERTFLVRHSVTNRAGETDAIRFRASEGADLYVSGSDSGHGLFVPGPPRQVGGINEDVGSVGALVEVAPPFSAFEANNFSTIGSKISNPDGPGFDGTIFGELTDNGVGVQWDQFTGNGLPDGQTANFEVRWRFVRFEPIALDPPSADKQTGETHTVTVRSENQDNLPQPGRPIVWEVTGANSASGTLTTGEDGTGQIEYLGAHPGTDTVTVFIDRDGDGTRDFDEPERIASVNWTGPPAPTAFESVNVGVESGTVLVDLPRGGSLLTRSGKRVRAARFVRLEQAAQIPLGSKLDTRRGTVRMLSAADTSGNFQAGNFRKGIFRVRQKRAARPVTTLRLRGGNFGSCVRNLGRNSKATAARRRIRRLRGNARGRFRTRGRYGSATVRGTNWVMTDFCSGTRTKVTEGSVRMKDFGRDRTVTVEAGERYFAKRRRGR